MDFISDNAGMLGLLFFFSVFVSLVLWTFRPSAKETYQSIAKTALQEDENDLK
jgi:cbb3-type cytochrome oxidase subunit 3